MRGAQVPKPAASPESVSPVSQGGGELITSACLSCRWKASMVLWYGVKKVSGPGVCPVNGVCVLLSLIAFVDPFYILI